MSAAEPLLGPVLPVMFTLISHAWTSSTSSARVWDETSPAAGQCVPTALLVQELLGGELKRAEVNGVSHYWNVLSTGEEVDLTRSQFTLPLTFEHYEPRERREVLRSVEVALRYGRLRQRYFEKLVPRALGRG